MRVIDRRSVLVAAAGGVLILAACGTMLNRFYRDPTFLPPVDFLQMWSTGRVLLAGGDPYDAEQLLPVQASAGRTEDWAIVMWYPPHALAMSIPFGLPDVRTGQLLWMLAQIVIAVWCADRVWRLYGGPARFRPAAWVAAVTAFPLMHLIFLGQTGGWVLLGLTGLLLAAITGRPWWALLGVFAAVKPHLCVPLGVALILNGCRTRRGAALIGWGVIGLAVSVALVCLFDPHVFAHYRHALARPEDGHRIPLAGWVPPLVAYHLRMRIDPSAFWIQFVPVVLAAIGTGVYWWVRRSAWDWRAEFPRLLLVGLIAAPYGAWEHDQIVLLIPVLAAGAELARSGTRKQMLAMVAVLGVINVVGFTRHQSESFIWVPPAVLVWYTAVTALARRAAAAPFSAKEGEEVELSGSSSTLQEAAR